MGGSGREAPAVKQRGQAKARVQLLQLGRKAWGASCMKGATHVIQVGQQQLQQWERGSRLMAQPPQLLPQGWAA